MIEFQKESKVATVLPDGFSKPPKTKWKFHLTSEMDKSENGQI